MGSRALALLEKSRSQFALNSDILLVFVSLFMPFGSLASALAVNSGGLHMFRETESHEVSFWSSVSRKTKPCNVCAESATNPGKVGTRTREIMNHKA